MKDLVDVVVFVDHHYGHVAVARVRESECCTVADVHDREAVERVTVLADHSLVVDRTRLTIVMPAVGSARLLGQAREHAVRLRARKVLYRHSNRISHQFSVPPTSCPHPLKPRPAHEEVSDRIAARNPHRGHRGTRGTHRNPIRDFVPVLVEKAAKKPLNASHKVET